MAKMVRPVTFEFEVLAQASGSTGLCQTQWFLGSRVGLSCLM
jgi:hypothetical protein